MKFSSKQIVTMVVAASAAIALMPIAVHATTGSSTNITDPVNVGSKARVNPTGTLWTTAVDPVTKMQAKVTSDGNQLIQARPAAPATPWNQINDIQVTSSTQRAVLFTTLGPSRLNLTSFTVSAEGPNAGTVRLFAIVYVSNTNSGNCLNLTGASFGAAERFVLTVPVGETTTITYPTPLVWSVYAGINKRYCVDVEGGGPASFVAHVSASGFLS